MKVLFVRFCCLFGDNAILSRERMFVNHLVTNFLKFFFCVAFGDIYGIIDREETQYGAFERRRRDDYGIWQNAQAAAQGARIVSG